MNWSYGSLVTPATPDEPESVGQDDSVAALLDAAEDIINDAVPGTLADLEEERRKRKKGLRGRFRRSSGDDPARPNRPSKKPGRGSGEGLGEKFRRRYRDGR